MKARIAVFAMIPLFCLSVCPKPGESASTRLIALNEHQSPFVAFNLWIQCGSQNDPPGKEGLAALTASLLAESSTRNNDYERILEKLYPMSAGYDSNVDKEMTVFAGRVHKDYLDVFYSLFKDTVLAPAFKEDDFKRIKMQTLNYVKQTRRFSNDEELSKELLFREIYRGTPYEHPEEGYAVSVDAIGLDDVKAFYAKYYTRDNITVAIGGGNPAGFSKKVMADFGGLPAGRPGMPAAPRPAPIEGLHFLLVEKNVNASPISFGFPISLLRPDKDFHAMMLFDSWMGEHRNSFGRLYQVIRETRGVNYGDYTYIEAFPRGYATQTPPVNVSRRSQIFETWIRPVAASAPGTLHDRTLFTLRAAMRELSNVAANGMAVEGFEATRTFLKNYTVNFGATLSRRLAYKVDDAFYSIPAPGFLASIKPGLDALTLDRVNSSIKKHLQAKNIWIVIITKDAEGFRRKLLSAAPTAITYSGPQPNEVIEEDKQIASFPIPVSEQNIKIINVNDVFER